MPFTKETAKALGRQGGLAPKPKSIAWDNIVGWLAGEGGHRYNELLAKQSNAIELSDPEREFMDRYYTLLEFHQPKLARNESKVEVEGTGFLLGIMNEK